MKRLLSFAVVVAFALSTPAFADDALGGGLELGPAGEQISHADAEKGRNDIKPQPSFQYLTPGLSGWYQQGLDPYRQQCNIVIDNVPVTGYCAERLSVMCVGVGVDGRGSAGYVVGAWLRNEPFVAPVTLPLYQAPLLAPVGEIRIVELGPNPVIGLNSAANQSWVRAARYDGDQLCPRLAEFDLCAVVGC